jgi:hypothetical protein
MRTIDERNRDVEAKRGRDFAVNIDFAVIISSENRVEGLEGRVLSGWRPCDAEAKIAAFRV